MIDQPDVNCLNCGRSEAEVPLSTWRYQGRDLRICPDCMPAFIHQRDTIILKKRAGSASQSAAATGETHA